MVYKSSALSSGSGGGGGGSGTVTSVDVSGGTTGLTTSGGPITTSGTITLAGIVNSLTGGLSGVTSGGFAASFTLPNPMNSIIAISFSVGTRSLTLAPMNAANSVNAGNFIFIKNTGATNSFAVKDNGGTTLFAAIQPGQVAIFEVLSNATAAGTFATYSPFIMGGDGSLTIKNTALTTIFKVNTSTDIVSTSNNSLDDGSGNAFFSGALTTTNNTLDDGLGASIFPLGNMQIGNFNNGGASLYIDGSLYGDGMFLFDGGGQYSKWTQSGGVTFLGGGGGTGGTQVSMFGFTTGNVSIGPSQVDWGTGLGVDGSFSCDAGTITTNGSGKVSKYNGKATTGWGVPAINGYARVTGKTAASTFSTYTVGAADGSFIVSANVLVTTATLHNFTVTCSYTDEGNTARVLTLQFSNLAGTFLTAIINTAGTVPYEGVALQIRCKASTAITIASAAGGTYTTVVYNGEGSIVQIA